MLSLLSFIRFKLPMPVRTADIHLCAVWSERLPPFFFGSLQVIDGKLAPFLSKVIKFASSHVFSCSLCREKGFICELCQNGQVLYPFQESTTKRYGVSFTLARSLNVSSRTPLQMMLDCHSFRFSLSDDLKYRLPSVGVEWIWGRFDCKCVFIHHKQQNVEVFLKKHFSSKQFDV